MKWLKRQHDVSVRGRVSRQRRRRMVMLLLLLVLVFAWQQEWIGYCLRGQVNRWLLPRTFSSERVTLQPLTLSQDAERGLLIEGIQLTVSPAWVRSILRASPYPAFVIPPGFLVDGLMTTGALSFKKEGAAPHQVPLYLHVQDHAGQVPLLHVRFPAASLNVILDAAFAEDWTETGEYLLGSYDLEQSIRFDNLRIWTEASDTASPMYPIVLHATATGQVRYRFRDGWVRMRVTARVRELSVAFILIPIAHPDGIGFDYRARIQKVDLRVSRMPRWIERRLASKVRSSLQRSLNHRRKRERLAYKRLPLWLPMALAVDVEIVNPPPDADVK